MPERELERELEALKRKHSENMYSAYANIIASDTDIYKNELEAVLGYYGIKYTIESVSLEDRLEEIKNKFNITCRVVTLDNGWYKDNMLPLLVKRGEEFKAVLPSFNGSCIFRDGRRRIRITGKNAASFDSKALCFYRGFEDEKVTRLSLIRYMFKCITAKEYAALIASMIAVTLFSTVIPQAQYYIFGHIIPAGTKGDILPMGCLLCGIIIISFVMYVYKGFVAANIPLNINANLQGAIISRLLSLKAGFFNGQRSGSLSSAITDISRLTALFSAGSIAAFISFLLSAVYAAGIYIYADSFVPFLSAAYVTVLTLTVINAVCLNRYRYNFAKKLNSMTGFVYELFSGMENVKLNNAGSAMFNRWGSFYSDSLRAQKKPFITKYYNAIYTLVLSAFTLVFFKTGIKADTDVSEFIVFMSLYGLFIGSVGGIGTVLNAAAEFNSSYGRLKDFFLAETEERENKRDIRKFEGSIEFSNVSFKYEGSDKNVLDDISFTVKKGQKTAITGKSGCGKSTLIRLLLGFEQPTSGRIFADNNDLNEINLSSYRKNLGVVLQSSKLIPADIISNITLIAPRATYEEVLDVIEKLGLKDDIEKMPMGLYTFVSDDNLTISGGQKQRILLARAFMGKPSMLVLDEATNALDNASQAMVTRYVDSLDTTAVIVAHRLSTVKECDNIIVLDNGKIAEQGNYDSLMQKQGIFYELVKNQMQ